MINKKKKIIIDYAWRYGLAMLLLLVLLFPYLFMLSKSFMNIVDINSPIVKLFPTKIYWQNYLEIVQYFTYFRNSLIVVLINAIFVPLTSCLVAFPLARFKFKGCQFLFALILATSMIPSSVLQVPQYFLFRTMGLYDKLSSQYIGAFLGGSGIQIFLIVQFMRAIPLEFDNAAMIDGANRWQIFYKIILPLCFNVCIFIGIGMAIGKWNDFQGPLIYLKSDDKFTIAVAFYYHFGSSGNASLLSNVKMAMAVTMTAFPALLFLFFQKQMIGGIKIGGLKG